MKLSENNTSTAGRASNEKQLPNAKCLVESKINKVSKPLKPLSNVSQEEMQQLLMKLKELVPSIPKNKKCSKLEIIQNVIDYIFDLETALESHSSVLKATNAKLCLKQCNNNCHNHNQHSEMMVSDC